MSPMDTQPVVTAGWISAAVAAVLTLITAFGVDLTEAQTTAVLGLVAVVAPLVSAYVSRQWAYAPDTVRALSTNHTPEQPGE